MRLPDDRRRFGTLRIAATLSVSLALAGCGALQGGAGDRPLAAVVPVNGPQADYPVVVGNSYTIAGKSFVPEDVLNYDQVGYIAADAAGGDAVSGSHHTLPLPSYVEVTSLQTGRTILVRMERRGPMEGTDLVALSPGALAQLEVAPGTPVRVRRVNPPEEQRALLRMGQPVPPRIDTPMPLVEVLKRKLPAPGTANAPQFAQAAPAPAIEVSTPAASAPAASATAGRTPALPSLATPDAPPVAAAANTSFDRAFVAPPAAPAPAAQRPQAAARRSGRFLVQVAAFSTADRAQRVARTLGGEVSQAGAFFRVRTGPFATRNEAEASLAKVRAAGYTDARIQTSG